MGLTYRIMGLWYMLSQPWCCWLGYGATYNRVVTTSFKLSGWQTFDQDNCPNCCCFSLHCSASNVSYPKMAHISYHSTSRFIDLRFPFFIPFRSSFLSSQPRSEETALLFPPRRQVGIEKRMPRPGHGDVWNIDGPWVDNDGRRTFFPTTTDWQVIPTRMERTNLLHLQIVPKKPSRAEASAYWLMNHHIKRHPF